MGTDTQDWVSSINLLNQALAELIVRPKYGTMKVKQYSGVSTTGLNTVDISSAKGQLYGGYFRDSKSADYFHLEIDGNAEPDLSFANYNTLNLNRRLTTIPYLVKYDDTNDLYVVGFSGGITFESSLKFFFYNTAVVPLIAYNFYYAEIE